MVTILHAWISLFQRLQCATDENEICYIILYYWHFILDAFIIFFHLDTMFGAVALFHCSIVSCDTNKGSEVNHPPLIELYILFCFTVYSGALCPAVCCLWVSNVGTFVSLDLHWTLWYQIIFLYHQMSLQKAILSTAIILPLWIRFVATIMETLIEEYLKD
jgi:hypothetical protein